MGREIASAVSGMKINYDFADIVVQLTEKKGTMKTPVGKFVSFTTIKSVLKKGQTVAWLKKALIVSIVAFALFSILKPLILPLAILALGAYLWTHFKGKSIEQSAAIMKAQLQTAVTRISQSMLIQKAHAFSKEVIENPTVLLEKLKGAAGDITLEDVVKHIEKNGMPKPTFKRVARNYIRSHIRKGFVPVPTGEEHGIKFKEAVASSVTRIANEKASKIKSAKWAKLSEQERWVLLQPSRTVRGDSAATKPLPTEEGSGKGEAELSKDEQWLVKNFPPPSDKGETGGSGSIDSRKG